VASLDVSTRYFTEDGEPLLTAAQVAEVHQVRTRTVYQWRRRGYLRERGLDDQGRHLYEVTEAARVAASPGCRSALAG
jgi:predicted site-specific integrase-resolvase